MISSDLFCIECGSPLRGGRCARHPELDQELGEALGAATGPSSPKRQWMPRAQVLRDAGLALMAFLLIVMLLLDLRGDRGTEQELASLRGQGAQLKEQLADEREASSQLSERLTALEAELEKNPDLREIAESTRDSVFLIEAIDAAGASASQGTGFVVASSEGESILLTNFHVIELGLDGGRISVRRKDETYRGRVIAEDQDSDLAAIRIDEEFPALELAEERPSVGDSVAVVASPLGLERSITTGVYSAFRNGFLQFSAAVSPGSSGGAILNAKGEVIGVVVAKPSDESAEGLGFGIPTSKACTSVIDC